MRSLGLLAVLAILWLLLSGYFLPLILAFGVLSCLLVVFVAWRMDVIDHEGHPVELGLRALTYFPWLAIEIVKANIGQVIYANSITLTPGTISLQIDGGKVLVHALSREGRQGVETGEMDRRVSAMTGGPKSQ